MLILTIKYQQLWLTEFHLEQYCDNAQDIVVRLFGKLEISVENCFV